MAYFPTPTLPKDLDYTRVYEPAEDTFLFLDALESQLSYIKETVRPIFCLEVGTGSGCVVTFLKGLLDSVGVQTVCFGTDVNDYAAQATLKTGQLNRVSLSLFT